MGMVLRTSNCYLFQSDDYGTRRQSRPPTKPMRATNPKAATVL
jgi:hypothetical protein